MLLVRCTGSGPAADGAPRPRRRRDSPGRRQGLRELAAARHRPGRHRVQRLPRRRATTQPVKLNEQPLTGPTHFADSGVDLDAGRRRTSCGRSSTARSRRPSRRFTLPADAPAQAVPVDPAPDAGRLSRQRLLGRRPRRRRRVRDRRAPGRPRPRQLAGAARPTEPILEAYKLDGTLLWRINLGKNIREGAHYTQFMVYDLDGDGRAEVAVQDRRRHDRRQRQGRSATPTADHRNARRLHPRRARSSSRSSTA